MATPIRTTNEVGNLEEEQVDEGEVLVEGEPEDDVATGASAA
jgi:hypothetical protein